MAKFTYQETLAYFFKHLNLNFSFPVDFAEEINIDIDDYKISFSPKDGFQMTLCLGFLLHPVRLERLLQLTTSNFLGVNTGGCTLFIDESGTSISLKITTTITTPPHENWDFLHRLLCVGKEWVKSLNKWEEFVPLVQHLPEMQL